MSTGRRYRSSLRDERARETHRRIRRSARELFGATGFGETTVKDIAADAGVAPQTVYAVFGSKNGIVAAILEDLEESAGLTERVEAIMAEEDPYLQLRLFISWIRAFFEQGAPVIAAMLSAKSDPDVAALAERGDQNRRGGTATLARLWADRGALHDDLKVEDAGQRLWLLTSAEQYLHAVGTLGWSPDRYERWLGDLLERELLKPR